VSAARRSLISHLRISRRGLWLVALCLSTVVLFVTSVLWIWSYWEFQSVRHVRSAVRDRVLHRSALSVTSACGELLFQRVDMEITGRAFEHASPSGIAELTNHPTFAWSNLEKSLAPFWSLPGKSIWNRMGLAHVSSDRRYDAYLDDLTRLGSTSIWDVLNVREKRRNVIIPHWLIILLTAPLPTWEGRRAWVVVATYLRSRRHDRRRLCPSCGYDVRATADPYGPRLPQCPECGHAVRGGTVATAYRTRCR
jgi:hypothetical protein